MEQRRRERNLQSAETLLPDRVPPWSFRVPPLVQCGVVPLTLEHTGVGSVYVIRVYDSEIY